VKLGKNASNTCTMLSEAYGGEAVKKSRVYEWYKRFKESSHVEITNENNACFYNKGTVHFEFTPQGQTTNQAYYVEILKRIREAVRRKRPELWPNNWILHHDNAPTHKALSAKQCLPQKSITEMGHSSHSIDLAPNDFWLFTKIKFCVKGPKISGNKTSRK